MFGRIPLVGGPSCWCRWPGSVEIVYLYTLCVAPIVMSLGPFHRGRFNSAKQRRRLLVTRVAINSFVIIQRRDVPLCLVKESSETAETGAEWQVTEQALFNNERRDIPPASVVPVSGWVDAEDTSARRFICWAIKLWGRAGGGRLEPSQVWLKLIQLALLQATGRVRSCVKRIVSLVIVCSKWWVEDWRTDAKEIELRRQIDAHNFLFVPLSLSLLILSYWLLCLAHLIPPSCEARQLSHTKRRGRTRWIGGWKERLKRKRESGFLYSFPSSSIHHSNPPHVMKGCVQGSLQCVCLPVGSSSSQRPRLSRYDEFRLQERMETRNETEHPEEEKRETSLCFADVRESLKVIPDIFAPFSFVHIFSITQTFSSENKRLRGFQWWKC